MLDYPVAALHNFEQIVNVIRVIYESGGFVTILGG